MSVLKHPNTLVRYLTPEATCIFSTRELWASAANTFNDPFEVVPRYDCWFDSVVDERIAKEFVFSKVFSDKPITSNWLAFQKETKALNAEMLDREMELTAEATQNNFSRDFGIICFSGNLESPALWGHYALSHKGFAIEFDPNHPMFHRGEFEQVIYSDVRPKLGESAGNHISSTKSSDWEYESEYRLLIHRLALKKRNEAGKEVRFIDLSPDSVRAVHFGLKMEMDAQERIINDLKSEEWKHVKTFVMRRHLTKFALEPKPWGTVKPITQEEIRIVEERIKMPDYPPPN